MSHPEKFEFNQELKSADVNRTFKLITEGVILSSSGIRTALTGKITIDELDPTLQSLLNAPPTTDIFAGDGTTTAFVLSNSPVTATVAVFLNGLRQREGVSNSYTISGDTVTFNIAPALGDLIDIVFASAAALAPFVIGSFDIAYRNILDMVGESNSLFLYATNEGSSIREVAKFDPIGITQIGSAVDVSSGSPDKTMMATLGGFVWAIGTSSGSNTISKITPATMASSTVSVTADTAATVTSLTADGSTFLYAFLKGGTFAPNSIVKLDSTGAQIGIIQSGFAPGPVGAVDMTLNLGGFLFVAFTTSAQVRRYDVTSGNLLNTFVFTSPIKVVPVDDNIYVLDGSNLQKISSTNVVTLLTTFPFTPTDMIIDPVGDLWISEGENLRKVDKNGSILRTLIPASTFTIQDVSANNGFIWTGYSNDTNLTINITKVSPGLPGV